MVFFSEVLSQDNIRKENKIKTTTMNSNSNAFIFFLFSKKKQTVFIAVAGYRYIVYNENFSSFQQPRRVHTKIRT